MPLTPAEVHNVAFKKPPIGKRGYDEEEVDAFLDIVEVELARLIEENNDLRSGRPGAAPSGGGVSMAELASARDENGRLQARIAELEKALTQGKDGTAQQLAHVQQQLGHSEQQVGQLRQQLQQAQLAAQQAQQQAQAAQRSGGGGITDEHHAQAVQMLALAQQTADQHLAQSKAEAERLLAESQANAHASLSNAQAQSDKQLADAKARGEQIERESAAKAAQSVHDAEQRVSALTAQLDQRKSALERRVEELRTFEREYRTRLKSYLESQLRDLDASGRAEPAAAEGQRAAS